MRKPLPSIVAFSFASAMLAASVQAQAEAWLNCPYRDVCIVSHESTGLFEAITGIDGEARSILKVVRRADAVCLAFGYKYLKVETAFNIQAGLIGNSVPESALTVSFSKERDESTLYGRLSRPCAETSAYTGIGRKKFARWTEEASSYWIRRRFAAEEEKAVVRQEPATVYVTVDPGVLGAAFPVSRTIVCSGGNPTDEMACRARRAIAQSFCRFEEDELILRTGSKTIQLEDQTLRCSDYR